MLSNPPPLDGSVPEEVVVAWLQAALSHARTINAAITPRSVVPLSFDNTKQGSSDSAPILQRTHATCMNSAIDVFSDITAYAATATRAYPTSAELRELADHLESEAARSYLVSNDVGEFLNRLCGQALATKTGDPIMDMIRYIEMAYTGHDATTM